MTWSNAQNYAQQLGGNLVVIETSEKNTWLANQFPGTHNWIGLYRNNVTSPWHWVTGQPEPPTYTNWDSGEPSGDGNYAEMVPPNGKWNDILGSTLQHPLVEARSLLASNSVLIPEPPATNRFLWRGHSLDSGFLRQTNGVSVFYSFVDDKNTNSVADAGDDFVTTEYLVVGTNYSALTSSRLPLSSSPVSQSYGLACANILNSSNDVFFTGETDGNVYSWVATNNTGALQRQLFDGHYQGKAWHQLGRHRGPETGEALVGLLVDPAYPNQASLIRWPPMIELPQQPDIQETAPTTLIMPTPNSGGSLSTVNITIWDAEGNKSYPVLQYQNPISSNWFNATIQTIDGMAFSPSLGVTAMPSGTVHTLVWNALADLGAGYSNNLLLQARSRDFMLTGDWSPTTSYYVAIPTDSIGDGIPDAWRLKYFPVGIPTNSQSCAACDPDGDGQNNLAEFLAGSDPTNSASAFRITSVTPINNDAKITWMTAGGRTNIVQATIDLSGSYSNLSPNIVITGSGDTTTNYLDVGGATNTPSRFYRIRLVP